jgi:hypothetical protein
MQQTSLHAANELTHYEELIRCVQDQQVGADCSSDGSGGWSNQQPARLQINLRRKHQQNDGVAAAHNGATVAPTAKSK